MFLTHLGNPRSIHWQLGLMAGTLSLPVYISGVSESQMHGLPSYKKEMEEPDSSPK